LTILVGGEGNDTILGANGNDVVTARGGNDYVDGAGGNDTIQGGAGVDTLLGGDGHDAIYGILKYEDYSDRPTSISTPDYMYGGAGNDRILTLGYDEVYGGIGDDYVWQFIDVLTLDFATNSSFPNNTNAIIEIWGKPYWDLLFNLEGYADIIDTGIGNDKIILNSARTISAGVGDDLVVLADLSTSTSVDGGDGFDKIVVPLSGSGTYTDSFGTFKECQIGLEKIQNFESISVIGAPGFMFDGEKGIYMDFPSSIVGDLENFQIDYAYRGSDSESQVYFSWLDISASVTFKVERSASTYSDPILLVAGGSGNDKIFTGTNTDTIFGGLGDDQIFGGDGDDAIYGGVGNDLIDGGDGVDILIFDGNYADYTISEITYNQFLVTDNVGTYGSDIIVDVNRIQFTDQNFEVEIRGLALFGDDSSEEINGGNESDQIEGSGGNDSLNGLDGNDLVAGGNGKDSLVGGLGNDFLNGNSGEDVLVGGTGNDVVNAGSGDDLIIGGNGAGNDSYIGGSGVDTVRYTSAKAGITINLSVNSDQAKSTLSSDEAGIGIDQLSGIENIIAGKYNDDLTGNAEKNRIDAGDGNDTLNGGRGSDVLVGGKGTDTFTFNAVNESGRTHTSADIITDFVKGKDKIDLNAINAFDSSITNDTFIWNGTAAFKSSTKGEVRFERFDNKGSNNDYTMVWIDNDHDKDVEMAIRLTGLHNLTASDFIL
jgi:Ca2+-binding RTX toxin-like protein